MLRRNIALAGKTSVHAVASQAPPLKPVRVEKAGSRAFPDVEVFTHDGIKASLYTDLIAGRAITMNFSYTSCGDTCPLVAQNLRDVQDLLADRLGVDLFMYSVTLQPELDTPGILREHAEQWGVRPGWRFLTGRPEDIERLRRAAGFASSDPEIDRVRDNHTGLLRYGNDRLDRWAACPALARPAWIAKAIATAALV